MRLLSLLVLSCLLAFGGYGQKAKPKKGAKPKKPVAVAKAPVVPPQLDLHLLGEGQPFALDTVGGKLSPTDAQNTNADGQKRYFDRYTLTLRQGDLLLVEYASEAYRVMLGLELPAESAGNLDGAAGNPAVPGNQGTSRASSRAIFSYDSAAFEVLSKHLFKFEVPASGKYTLLLTSADAAKTGPYRVRKFILPAKAILPGKDADFCQKLTFLMAESLLDFNRIEGKKGKSEKKTGLIENYASSFAFGPGQPGQIARDRDLHDAKFSVMLGEFAKKEEALKALDTYATQLKACTPGWEADTREGEAFKEVSAATYADYIAVAMRVLGKKKFAVILSVN